MNYSITDIPNGKRVAIDLPVDIVCVDFSFTYYDEESKCHRDTHIGYWVVCPDDKSVFKVSVKELHKVTTAVNYARSEYVKFLKQEIRRVKGCDDDI